MNKRDIYNVGLKESENCPVPETTCTSNSPLPSKNIANLPARTAKDNQPVTVDPITGQLFTRDPAVGQADLAASEQKSSKKIEEVEKKLTDQFGKTPTNVVEKVASPKVIYGNDNEGKPTYISYGENTPNGVVVRDSTGRMISPDPLNGEEGNQQVVNKRFLLQELIKARREIDAQNLENIRYNIQQIVGLAPEQLDTIYELADAYLSIGIGNFPGVLTEDEILALWDTAKSGKYTVVSEEYGSEFLFIDKREGEEHFFSRMLPSGKVLTYDFEEEKWKQVSGGGGTGEGGVGSVAIELITPYTFNSSVNSKTEISLSWSSETPGSGMASIYIGKDKKAEQPVSQGAITLDISDYVTTPAKYAVKITIEDALGNKGTRLYTVNIVSLLVDSLFVDNTIAEGNVEFYYTVMGRDLNKHVYLQIDDNEPVKLGTFSAYEGSDIYTITDLTHGAHTLKLFAKAKLDENNPSEDSYNMVTSNIKTYSILYVEHGDTTPIISTKFTGATIKEGQSVTIDYIAYTPGSILTTVKRIINGVETEVTHDQSVTPWNISSYNVGTNKIALKSGSTEVSFDLVVEPFVLNIAAVANPILFLSSQGKDNNQNDKDVWESQDDNGNPTSAGLTTFENFVFGNRDGWLLDKEGLTALHVTGNAKATINYAPFGKEAITGKTIEIEFATQNVVDYDAPIINIMSEQDDIGIIVYPNRFTLKSSLKEITTKFKEDEHIRISVVVTPNGNKALIYTYVNGVISGVVPRATGETFLQQLDKRNIVIGSDKCDTLVYKIRVYDKMLSYTNILHNFIVDTENFSKQQELYVRNVDIIAEDGSVSYEGLHNVMPIITIITPEGLPLPSGENEERPGCTVRIHYPGENGIDITYTNVTIKPQGTSSLEYAYKNFDLDFSDSPEAQLLGGIQLYDDAIPEMKVTLKADYASSAGVYNASNAKIVNELYQENNPRQEEDPRVRNTIYGSPIVMFYKRYASTPESFYYKGSLNLSKASNALGYQEGDESWELRNNISPLVIFRTNDFTSIKEDFKARYPKNASFDKIKELITWINSCCEVGETAADDILNEEKFAAEVGDWFNLHYLKMYYVYVMVMGGIDSLAKNMMLTYFAQDGKWYPQLYDMDTSYGIDNQGRLTFNYDIEPGDVIGDDFAYKGSNSVLWRLVERVFADELQQLYYNLRKDGLLSYETMFNVLYDNGIKIYPKAIYNIDTDVKYISVYKEKNDDRLWAALGDTLDHLQFWVSNRINYLDSRWMAPDYTTDRIAFRITNPEGSDHTAHIKAYRDMYISVQYGSSEYTFSKRYQKSKDEECVIVPQLPTGNDFPTTESYVYGAKSITDVGDLSKWYCAYFNSSNATKLSKIKLGDGDPYNNPSLESLVVGSNTLLREVDIRNCTNNKLNYVDLSACPNLETFLAEGTKLTNVTFSNGGELKTIILPDTIKQFSLINQKKVTSIISQGMYTYLRVEYPNTYINDYVLSRLSELVGTEANPGSLLNMRVLGIDWILPDVSLLHAIMNNVKGIDNNGNVSDTLPSVLTGKIHINGAISQQDYDMFISYWGANNLIITADQIVPVYTCNFYNYDGTLLYTTSVYENATVTYGGETPTKPIDYDLQEKYTFSNWSPDITLLITEDTDFIAEFSVLKFWKVRWLNWDNTPLVGDYFVDDGNYTSYKGTTPTRPNDDDYSYTFSSWSPNPTTTPITQDTDFIAQFVGSRLVTVTWLNGDGSTLLTQQVGQGQSVTYTGATPTKANTAEYKDFVFTNWLGSDGNTYENIILSVPYQLTLTPQFTGTLQVYNVYWKSEGTILETDQVQYGGTAEYNGDTPQHSSGYTFVGWGTDDFTIYGDTTFNAVFDEPTVFNITVREAGATPSITVRGISETYDLTINWGDGTTDTYALTSGTVTTCTKSTGYASTGDYVVTLPAGNNFEFYSNGSSQKLLYPSSKVRITSTKIMSNIANANLAFSEQYSLKEVTLSNNVTKIPNQAFYYCENYFTSLVVPDSVIEIGDYAFEEADNFANIQLGSGVQIIGGYSFKSLKKLTNVVFPKSVTTIKSQAFAWCSYLEKLDFSNHTTIPTLLNVDAFINVGTNVGGCQAILPDDLYDEWITATNWVSVTTLTYVKASEVA